MLKACLNGSRRPTDHPWLPTTPTALAADAVRAVEAGASALHVHPKNHEGADTLDPTAVADALGALRLAVPGVPVGVTTGAWALPDPDERVSVVSSWPVRPDFASVNWHEAGAERVAAALLEAGIGVEAGIWHREGLEVWLASPLHERCLRVLVELQAESSPDDADDLLGVLRRAVPDVPPLLLHGEGASAWPLLRHAIALGLDTRIGLEDTLVLPNGSAAGGNEALVRAAVDLGAR